MRARAAAALAAILGMLATPALAQSSSQPIVLTPDSTPDNGAIAVPPAPLITPSPPQTPATPVTPTPATPGLVQAAPAPPDGDNGDTNADDAGSGTVNNPAPVDGTAAPSPGQPGTAAADTAPDQDQDTIPAPPNDWQPGTAAQIAVLDKIDGDVTQISVPVGGQSVVGDLQVSVLACVLRPAGEVPDAAAFVALQNAVDPSAPPGYRGWVIRSEPGAAIAGDASEVLRVVACS